jgi:hypothetical protein
MPISVGSRRQTSDDYLFLKSTSDRALGMPRQIRGVGVERGTTVVDGKQLMLLESLVAHELN